jgi:hypothetical protein
MNGTRAFSRRILSIFVCGIALSTSLSAFAEETKGPALKAPIRVAALPPKPESKKYDFQYKLKRGDVLRYDVTHSASIQSTIEKTTQAAQTRTDSIKVWKVTDVLPEGNIEFMNVVERVHMINQLPERSATEYDSVKDKIAPPGYEDAAKAIGVPLSTVQMTPRGRIVSRVNKIPGQNATEDAPIALRLPEQPVAIGDTWDEPFDVQVKLDNGGVKPIQTRRHHQLADVKDGIATIEVTYQVLSPIDAPVEVKVVDRLMNGTVEFDIKNGRVIGQKMNVDKRILGFAGATSSVQYVMKMEEKLLKEEPKTADKPTTTSTAKNNKNSTKTSNTKTVRNSNNKQRPTQTASRPKSPSQQQPQYKTYRR